MEGEEAGGGGRVGLLRMTPARRGPGGFFADAGEDGVAGRLRRSGVDGNDGFSGHR